MKRLILAIVCLLTIGCPAHAQWDFLTTGARSARVWETTCSTSVPALSAPNMSKWMVPCAGVGGYSAGNIYISQNAGPWTLLSSFIGSGAVSSVFNRTGAVQAAQGDYASFYAPIVSPTFTGNSYFNLSASAPGEVVVSGFETNLTLQSASNYPSKLGFRSAAGAHWTLVSDVGAAGAQANFWLWNSGTGSKAFEIASATNAAAFAGPITTPGLTLRPPVDVGDALMLEVRSAGNVLAASVDAEGDIFAKNVNLGGFLVANGSASVGTPLRVSSGDGTDTSSISNYVRLQNLSATAGTDRYYDWTIGMVSSKDLTFKVSPPCGGFCFEAPPTLRLLGSSGGAESFGAEAQGPWHFFGDVDVDGNARATSIRLNKSAYSRPACDATIRGIIWYVPGGAGVTDSLEVCSKDAADAYAWRNLY